MKDTPPPHPPAPAPSSVAPAVPPGEPLDWPAKTGAVEDVLRELRARVKHHHRRRLRVAAGVAALALAAGAALRLADRPAAPAGAPSLSATVIVSTPARQILDDGSMVELRNDAKITVAFTASVRHVILDHGEAYFQVAKSAARPFVVTADGLDFRAVGTAFSVSIGRQRVEMLVTNGCVSVCRSGAAAVLSASTPPSLALVTAGHRVVVDLAAPRCTPPAADALSSLELNQRLAWRAPKLEFSGTPLADAVRMMNRYAGENAASRLVIGDPALASIRLTGILRADDINALVDVVAADYGVRIERRKDGEIVLLAAQ